MQIHDFWLFAIASLLLNLTPGNDMLYVITRSTGQGVKAGVVSAVGIMAGCCIHTIAAVVGLSAIIANSVFAFNLIKYAGAAYLLYLGLRALFSKTSVFAIQPDPAPLSYQKLFWQGVLTNVLNPKVAIFFLAFLPQFIITGSQNPQLQILLLGIWFNISGTLVNSLVAVLFGTVGKLLAHSRVFLQWQKRITGAVLIALGIKVALTSSK